MSDRSSTPLQAKEKAETVTPAEQTKEGVAFTPAVDIFETEHEIIMLADMPGVKPKDLDIDLNDNVLALKGEVVPPEGENEVDILREYHTGTYYRQFKLSQVIDQSNIGAELKDGVLRLILPKMEAATPRKISVKAG